MKSHENPHLVRMLFLMFYHQIILHGTTLEHSAGIVRQQKNPSSVRSVRYLFVLNLILFFFFSGPKFWISFHLKEKFHGE